MPPNLGGFFMVRSYYPSECHADYFDFERIEALKPAIEACGISTLSQSPMLGFHRSEERRVGKECRSRWSQDHGEKELGGDEVRGTAIVGHRTRLRTGH